MYGLRLLTVALITEGHHCTHCTHCTPRHSQDSQRAGERKAELTTLLTLAEPEPAGLAVQRLWSWRTSGPGIHSDARLCGNVCRKQRVVEQQRTEEEVKEGSGFEACCQQEVKSSGFDSSSSPAPLEKISRSSSSWSTPTRCSEVSRVGLWRTGFEPVGRSSATLLDLSCSLNTLNRSAQLTDSLNSLKTDASSILFTTHDAIFQFCNVL